MAISYGVVTLLRQMVTVDYDGVSTKLMIILMIVLGIWVIRVSGNFIRNLAWWHGMTLDYIAWCCMELHDIAWHGIGLYWMVLHNVAWHWIALHGVAWRWIAFRPSNEVPNLGLGPKWDQSPNLVPKKSQFCMQVPNFWPWGVTLCCKEELEQNRLLWSMCACLVGSQ